MTHRQFYIVQILTLALLLFFQTTVVPLFAVDMYVPDLLLLWVIYIALSSGQIEATIIGFVAGLFQDIVATHLLGLTSLTKTLTGFVAGYFYNENMVEQTLSSPRVIGIVAALSFFHDVLYFLMLYQGVRESVMIAALESSLAATLYTTLVSIVPFFYFTRKFRAGWIRS